MDVLITSLTAQPNTLLPEIIYRNISVLK